MTRFKTLLASALLSIPLAGIATPAHAEVYELGWPYPPNNLEPYPSRNPYPPSCNPTNKPGPDRLRGRLR